MTVASGGTLTIGNGVDGNGEVNGTITDNGAVILNRPFDWDSKTVFAGNGNIRKQAGTGQVTMIGSSPSFTGTVDITSGRVRVNSFDALGSTTAAAGPPRSPMVHDWTSAASPPPMLPWLWSRVFVVAGSGDASDPNARRDLQQQCHRRSAKRLPEGGSLRQRHLRRRQWRRGQRRPLRHPCCRGRRRERGHSGPGQLHAGQEGEHAVHPGQHHRQR